MTKKTPKTLPSSCTKRKGFAVKLKSPKPLSTDHPWQLPYTDRSSHPLLCQVLLLLQLPAPLDPGCSVIQPGVILPQSLYFPEEGGHLGGNPDMFSQPDPEAREQQSSSLSRKPSPQFLIQQTLFLGSCQLLPQFFTLSQGHGVDDVSCHGLLLGARLWKGGPDVRLYLPMAGGERREPLTLPLPAQGPEGAGEGENCFTSRFLPHPHFCHPTWYDRNSSLYAFQSFSDHVGFFCQFGF